MFDIESREDCRVDRNDVDTAARNLHKIQMGDTYHVFG